MGPWDEGPVSPGRRWLLRFLLISVAFGATLFSTIPVEAACQSVDPCFAYYYGLFARQDENPTGTILAEIDAGQLSTDYNRNQSRRIVTDPDGDRQQVEARFRDRVPGGNVIYVWGTWYNNGQFCFPTMIGIGSGAGPSQAGVSVGFTCTTGFHFADDSDDKSLSYNDANWHLVELRIVESFRPQENANKVNLQVCEEQAFSPDDCVSGGTGRLLGVDYS
jgi:hypothetical protein